MEVQSLESIVAELLSDDWLEAGCAIHKLIPYGETASAALPMLFELTLHDKVPLASDSARFIKRLGKHAVSFLRDQVAVECPRHRAMAITLLTETGGWEATSTQGIEQVLRSRRDDLPDWGVDPEEIIRLFKSTLDDESLAVRFNAACALEEFGRHVPETVPIFIDAIQTGTPHQQHWAALHLGRIVPLAIAACDALAMAAESNCQDTAMAASNALKRLTAINRLP